MPIITETKEQVNQFIFETLNNKYNPESEYTPFENPYQLLSDLELDSLDVVELMMDIEMQYNISIDDEEFEKLIDNNKTINDLIDFIFSQIHH